MRLEWKEAVLKMNAELSTFRLGGAVLRDYIRKKVDKLDALRRRLFRTVCVGGKDAKDSEAPARGGLAAVVKANNVALANKQSGAVGGESRRAHDCSFGGGAPIMEWSAPDAAQIADKLAWKNAKEDTLRTISSFNKGGQVLRDFIRKQLNTLDVLRHELFVCE